MENKIRKFTDLVAWQEGHKLVLMIYKETKTFPKEELFGIIMQMRRAAISITSNIAEGFSRKSNKEKTQFDYLAQGSLTELQNQLIASKDIGFLSFDSFKNLFDQTTRVNKLINGLIKYSRSYT